MSIKGELNEKDNLRTENTELQLKNIELGIKNRDLEKYQKDYHELLSKNHELQSKFKAEHEKNQELLIENHDLKMTYNIIYQLTQLPKEPLYAYAKDCNYDPKNCSTEENLCDGIVHCLDGRDEHDCLQKANFPEEATFRCIEDQRGKYNLEIL